MHQPTPVVAPAYYHAPPLPQAPMMYRAPQVDPQAYALLNQALNMTEEQISLYPIDQQNLFRKIRASAGRRWLYIARKVFFPLCILWKQETTRKLNHYIKDVTTFHGSQTAGVRSLHHILCTRIPIEKSQRILLFHVLEELIGLASTCYFLTGLRSDRLSNSFQK